MPSGGRRAYRVAMTVTSSPVHLGLFAHLADERGDLADVYERHLDLFAHAEHLGVEYAWVRQFHLGHPGDRVRPARGGGLPSPFVFLSALAQRTTRLRLGTSAVTLPLENPVRVAEDAAVLDALSGGRVELGLANGGQPSVAAALGVRQEVDRDARRRAYLDRVDRVRAALRGEALNDDGEHLAPLRPGLADRIWHATLTADSALDTGRRGEGVLIGTTQVVPGEVSAAAYHRGLATDAVPRLGLSTWVFPGADRESALRDAEEGLRRKWAWGGGFLPPAHTLAEIAASLNLHYGTAEQIAESISTHPAFAYTTHVHLQLDGLYAGLEEQKDALALIVAEVAPHLSRPTTAVAA